MHLHSFLRNLLPLLELQTAKQNLTTLKKNLIEFTYGADFPCLVKAEQR